MKHIKHLGILVFPGILTCALVNAQGGGPAAGEWETAFGATVVLEDEVDIDAGGTLERQAFELDAEVVYGLSERTTLGIGLGYGESDYQSQTFDTVENLSVDASYGISLSREDTLFIGLSAESNREARADFDDSLSYGLSVGWLRFLGPRLQVGLIVSAETGLEDDDISAYPLISWQFADNWRFQSRDLPGIDGGVAEIVYLGLGDYELAAGAGYGDERWLRPATGGYIERSAGIAKVSVNRTFDSGLTINALIGHTFAQELEFEDEDGNGLGGSDADGGLVLSFSVNQTF